MLDVPDWLEAIDFPKSDSCVKLVFAKPRGQFDTLLEAEMGISDNAKLIIAALGGSGTLVDVGANIGSIALVVASTGSKVLAVEMLPDNVAKLSFGMLVNGFSNFRIVQAAASNREAILSYTGGEAWASVTDTGSSALALRLDTILAMTRTAEPGFVARPIFLKVDVEGHEPEVLEGSSALIAEFQPTILFEAIDFPGDAGLKARAAKEWLHNAGYDLYLTRSDVLIPYGPADIQIGLVCDFLAVPRGSLPEIAGYRVGELPLEATEAWLREMVPISELHRAHALKVVRASPHAPFAKSVLKALSNSPEDHIRSEVNSLLMEQVA